MTVHDEKEIDIKKVTLPNIPGQVNTSALDKNGRLISVKTSEKIKFEIESGRLQDAVNKGKVSKKELQALGIDSNYSLIVTKDKTGSARIFAQYLGEKHGKHLGKGAAGIVKAVQDIETGKFYASKILKSADDAARIKNEKEEDLLTKIGLMIGKTDYVPAGKKSKYGGKAHVIIMELIPGKESSEFSATPMTSAERNFMMMNIIEAVKNVHQHNILHLDLKEGNVLYDPLAAQAKVIDLDRSKLIDSTGKISTREPIGTPAYMPSEVRNKIILVDAAKSDSELAERRKQVIEYSVKSDVYSLGCMLSMLLKLARPSSGEDIGFKFRYISIKTLEESKNNEYLPDDKIRANVIDFLNTMMADNPEQRPSMEQVSTFFKSLQPALIAASDPKTRPVIDVGSFNTLDEKAKQAVVKELTQYDVIQLIGTGDTRKTNEFMAARDYLESYGLTVKRDVYYGFPTVNSAIEHIANTRSPTEPKVIDRAIDYHHLSYDKAPTLDNAYQAHDKVDASDFSPDGRLLTIKARHDIIQAIRNGKIKLTPEQGGRITKKELRAIGIPSDFSVMARQLENGDIKLYAIYRGVKNLGSGSFGKVKLIQDQDNGKFYAEKVTRYKRDKTDEPSASDKEASKLDKLHELVDHFTYKPQSIKNKEFKYCDAIIMEIAPGRPLSAINRDQLTGKEMVNIFISSAQAVKNAHDADILHNDIKSDNLFYDPVSGQSKLIDYGASHDITDTTKNYLQIGSPLYNPPGTQRMINLNGKSDHEIKAIDIYQLGITMAEMAGLIQDDPRKSVFELAPLNSEIYRNSTVIKDSALKQVLHELFSQMTNKDPVKRPNIDQIAKYLNTLDAKVKARKLAEVGKGFYATKATLFHSTSNNRRERSPTENKPSQSINPKK